MAQSAIRAGFRPICFDYFGDVDLQHAVDGCGGSVTKIDGYDDATRRLLDDVPADVPLMYGGAVENHPEFVDAVARSRPVWGVTGDALRRCRNPWELQRVAERCGLFELACHRERPAKGQWIWKPFASGGSLDVGNPECGKPGYWQKFAEGWGSYSAFGVRSLEHGLIYLGFSDIDNTGETVSRRGREHGTVIPPHYRNGVISLDPIAMAMADELDLCGAFGLDLIDDGITICRTVAIEINPRFTATSELHERISGISIVGLHAAAFDNSIIPTRWDDVPLRTRKVVFFAPNRLRAELPRTTPDNAPFTQLADIPPRGTIIEPTHPICSVIFDDVQEDEQVAQHMDAEQFVLSRCVDV